MSKAATISPAIVEALYEDALLLADEARTVFDESYGPQAGMRAVTWGGTRSVTAAQHEAQVVLSCEALRTTTRMMHALAWLLNHRAYFAGEMSEFQLRRHGRLPPPQPESDPAQLAVLDPHTRMIIERTRRFYARVARLDRAWRAHFAMQPTAVHRLRERLGAAFG
ncbi:DUF1465 family protein [Erythrobacter arachoides]|uniref:DUF1465 family protein n=1 Tax=Aurantiacibacter arachoides TaxID=1850444 RepID=A0A844ZYK3_9SPHN|nr:DUF1465 family protein [Aurantiacibacter arachoides]MXO92322.1 DUF1465 family protein [Aurantiacibacter arachoides]GGD58085.1 hypothetical protein GCM10011411_17690 [Aurantiacibacter arachoides]